MTRDKMAVDKYTVIENPVDIRKNLLISSKSLIQILMIYEKFKVIRRERLEKMNQLKHVIEEINELMGKIMENLPAIKEEHSKENTIPKKTTKKVQSENKQETSAKRKRKNKIEKLYDQLKEIDDTLKNLS